MKALPSITGMIAIITGVILFTGCQKDISVDNPGNATDESVSARASSSVSPRAGADQTITLPTNSVSFDGSGSYSSSGSITSYAWSKDLGGSATITSPSSAKTTVTGLASGSYRFKLTVKDSRGNSAYDTVHVTVNGTGGTTPANQSPSVNIATVNPITMPVSTVTLTGTASDPDGTIASYQWTKTSGGNATIMSPNAAATLVNSLAAGSYVFNLKVTDNKGASSNKSVNVTVNAASGGGGTTPPPTGGTGGYNTLVYSNDYDNSSSINSNQLGSGSISTSVVKSGSGSFKSVVYAGASQISSGWRSEQQYTESYSPNNTEIAVEYDELFESLPSVGGLSVQWHGNTSGTSGQMSMWITGGKFQVQRNTTGTAGSPNIYQSGTLMSIQTNRWYHVRWEIKFTSGSDGYVRCYIDGNLYYSVTGKTSDGSGQYLKIGQNLFQSPSNNSILYFDNLRVWKK